MKIRHDAAFLSSLLFTIAFVRLAPWSWEWATLHGAGSQINADLQEVFLSQREIGILSLAVILIGLIVVWTGYLKKLRWTWFIMFVIVFGCTPILIFQDGALSPQRFFMPASEWLRLFADAVRGEPRIARAIVEEMLLFLLMVAALFLPVKSFFFGSGKGFVRSCLEEGCPKETK